MNNIQLKEKKIYTATVLLKSNKAVEVLDDITRSRITPDFLSFAINLLAGGDTQELGRFRKYIDKDIFSKLSSEGSNASAVTGLSRQEIESAVKEISSQYMETYFSNITESINNVKNYVDMQLQKIPQQQVIKQDTSSFDSLKLELETTKKTIEELRKSISNLEQYKTLESTGNQIVNEISHIQEPVPPQEEKVEQPHQPVKPQIRHLRPIEHTDSVQSDSTPVAGLFDQTTTVQQPQPLNLADIKSSLQEQTYEEEYEEPVINSEESQRLLEMAEKEAEEAINNEEEESLEAINERLVQSLKSLNGGQTQENTQESAKIETASQPKQSAPVIRKISIPGSNSAQAPEPKTTPVQIKKIVVGQQPKEQLTVEQSREQSNIAQKPSLDISAEARSVANEVYLSTKGKTSLSQLELENIRAKLSMYDEITDYILLSLGVADSCISQIYGCINYDSSNKKWLIRQEPQQAPLVSQPSSIENNTQPSQSVLPIELFASSLKTAEQAGDYTSIKNIIVSGNFSNEQLLTVISQETINIALGLA